MAGLTTARYDAWRRIVFLDCVRGIAASIVVVGHFFELHSQHGIGPQGTSPGPYARWTLENLNLGRVGVAAFFLVSGYVIPLSLERQSQRTFWIRRFFRLYPVYWIAMPAYLVIAAISGWNSITARTLVLNVLMVQGVVGAISLLPPGWTLGIELVFYAQSAASALRRWLDRAVHLGWVWLVLFLALAVASRVLGRDMHSTPPLLLYTAALGHALYLRDARGSHVWRWLFAAGAVLIPVGASLGQGMGPSAEWQWQPFGYAASWATGVTLFCAFYALRDRSLPRMLTWLGSISYSIYLTHPTVFLFFVLLWGQHSFVTLVASFIGVVLVSWGLHALVERPSINIGRALTRRPREPVALGEADIQAAP